VQRIGWIAFLSIVLAACSHVPDDQRIRDQIEVMQHAMESHNLHGFMEGISDDFTGNDGTVDSKQLANLLRIEILRNDQVGVTLGPIDVELQDKRAVVDVTATFTGGSGSLIPEHAAIYAIRSGWKKDGSRWRCFNATWDQKL
jgi:hypothetical protein